MPDDNDEEKPGAPLVSLEVRARTMMILEGLGMIAEAVLGPVVREIAREVSAPQLPAKRDVPRTWCIPVDLSPTSAATYCALARKPARYPKKAFRTLCGRDVPSNQVPAVVARLPSCAVCGQRLAERTARRKTRRKTARRRR